MIVNDVRSKTPSESESLEVALYVIVLRKSISVESFTAVGAMFAAVIVTDTVATLLVSPASSSIVYWKVSVVVPPFV